MNIFILVFDGCTGCSYSSYDYTIVTTRSYELVNGFDWDDIFIWVLSWFTCCSFYCNAPLTGTLGGTAGGLAFMNISASVLNALLCIFPILTSGIVVAGLCSA